MLHFNLRGWRLHDSLKWIFPCNMFFLKLPYAPLKFNIDPEIWWLEDKPFLLGFGNFSGARGIWTADLVPTFGDGPKTSNQPKLLGFETHGTWDLVLGFFGGRIVGAHPRKLMGESLRIVSFFFYFMFQFVSPNMGYMINIYELMIAYLRGKCLNLMCSFILLQNIVHLCSVSTKSAKRPSWHRMLTEPSHNGSVEQANPLKMALKYIRVTNMYKSE